MTNRRSAVWLTLLTAMSLAGLAHAAPKSAVPQSCNGGTGCPGSTCPTSIAAAQATLPADACPKFGEFQSAVDVFSWNEFIALNWPATTSCTADMTKSILNVKNGNDGPVVWQTLASSDNVFVAPGQSPAAWCTGDALSALFAKTPRLMGTTSKSVSVHNLRALTQAVSQPTGVQAVGGVVTDQSQRWLRYEKLMNQIEYPGGRQQQLVSAERYQRASLDHAADRVARAEIGVEDSEPAGNRRRQVLHDCRHRL